MKASDLFIKCFQIKINTILIKFFALFTNEGIRIIENKNRLNIIVTLASSYSNYSSYLFSF